MTCASSGFALKMIGHAFTSFFSLLTGGKIARAGAVSLDPEMEEPF